LDITFETLTLNDQDDDDGAPETVEIYGYLQVDAPSSALGSSNYLTIGSWERLADGCPSDTGDTNADDRYCPERLPNGTHDFNNLYLLNCGTYKNPFINCSIGNLFYFPLKSNNTLRVAVAEGDSISITAGLWDYDEISADDWVCMAAVGITAVGVFESGLENKSLFEWGTMQNETFGMFGYGDYGGTCSIIGTINAVN